MSTQLLPLMGAWVVWVAWCCSALMCWSLAEGQPAAGGNPADQASGSPGPRSSAQWALVWPDSVGSAELWPGGQRR